MINIRAFILILLLVFMAFAVTSYGENISGYEPFKKAITDSVDISNLMMNLRYLTGEIESEFGFIESRHAHSEDIDMSLSFLSDKFIDYGYYPVYDSFSTIFDILSIDCSFGILASSGRHGVLLGELPINITDETIAQYPFVNDVCFIDESTGYAVAGKTIGDEYLGGILKYSSESGWTEILSDIPYLTALDFGNSNIAYTGGLNGVLYRIHTSDDSIDSLPAMPSMSLINDVCFVDSVFGAICGYYGAFAITYNGAESFESISLGTMNMMNNIAYNGSGSFLVGGENGSLYRVDTSAVITTVLISTTSDITDIYFDEVGTGYFTSANGEIYVSYDGGDIWARIWNEEEAFGLTNAINAIYAIEDTFYIGGDRSRYMVSQDGAETFIDLPTENKWANIYAEKSGLIDSLVVMTAHFDAVSENPFIDAPGADDNGTGTIIVLETARVLQDVITKLPIRFLLCNAEEIGLSGSSHHLRNHPDDNYGYCLNIDQVGYHEDGDLYALKINGDYDDNSNILAERLKNEMNIYSSPLTTEIVTLDATLYSDHYHFWEHGVRAVTIEEWNRTPNYHTTSDLIENIDSLQYYYAAKAAIAGMIELVHPIANIQGRIANGENDSPLANATIQIEDQTARSNDEGMFFFQTVEPGRHYLTATKDGFDTLQLYINIVSETSEKWYDMYLFESSTREESIKFSILEIDDDYIGSSYGNDDGIIATNERIELWMTIFSTMPETTEGLCAILSNLDGEASVLDSISHFSDLRAYDRINPEDPFNIRISYMFLPEDEIEFDITLLKNYETAEEETVFVRHFALGGAGIEEHTLPDVMNLSVYPNPVNGTLNLDRDTAEKLSIYNISGKLIAAIGENQNSLKLDNSFTTGLYIITNNSGEIKSKFTVVR